VWRTGRLTQGFSPSETEAKHQADLAQHANPARRR
jgi:hypothetical protein